MIFHVIYSIASKGNTLKNRYYVKLSEKKLLSFNYIFYKLHLCKSKLKKYTDSVDFRQNKGSN